MNFSKIRVLIADDDVYKGHAIRRALEFNGVRNSLIVRNQERVWEEICRGSEKIDLIVSDMQYPLEAGAPEDPVAGLKLIQRMEREDVNIPVIICSSLDYQIPQILGSVWYNELRDLNSDFRELLHKLDSQTR